MENPIFRKKSLDRVSSPEQLNDYIRVSNPGVWMLLTAVIVLLVGVCIWGVFGHLDTVLSTAAVSEDGKITYYVKAEDISSVTDDMEVRIGGKQYAVSAVATKPVAVPDLFDDYTLHTYGLQNGEWVYPVTLLGSLSEGTYRADIVVESVSPISFVLN